MAKKKKKDIKTTMSDIWRVARDDFDSAMSETSKLIKRGEKHVKSFSDKSKDRLELISAKLRRESLYYKLGKKVSVTAKSKWKDSKTIDSLRSEISKLSREIKSGESKS
jgi:predicted  nucleic acid-binding Zn-ribbon protein